MNKLLSGIAVGFCLIHPGQAQQGKAGTKYGTREPETCASTKEPAKGAPSPALVKRYLRCHVEGVGPGGKMYLIENVNVEVGKGTPFLQLSGGQRPFGADPDGLVYAIRGSFTSYQCAVPSAIMNNFGKNCATFENKHATGECFRSAFGDWTCNMTDTNAINDPQNRYNVAPPK